MVRDWGGYGDILNNPPVVSDRVDCPYCGEVLEVNNGVWNCPRFGPEHWHNPFPPRD